MSSIWGCKPPTNKRTIAVCSGPAQLVRIIPAVAAPDNNHGRAAANGVGWFQGLGVADVRAVAIVDRASADRPDLSEEIEHSRLAFMLGGFTRYLAETLSVSVVWQAIVSTHRVVVPSSPTAGQGPWCCACTISARAPAQPGEA